MSAARRRGTRAETAVVEFLRASGFTHAERRAPAGTRDRGDVAGVPGVVVEVKDCARTELAGWLDEAGREADNARARLAVVWHKRRGRGSPAEWFVTMSGSTFAVLLAEPDVTCGGLRGDDAEMSDETIPREQVEQTAAGLRRLLDQVADGTMTAGSGTVAGLEGAVAAVEGLLAACGSAESGPARMGEEVP